MVWLTNKNKMEGKGTLHCEYLFVAYGIVLFCRLLFKDHIIYLCTFVAARK